MMGRNGLQLPSNLNTDSNNTALHSREAIYT
jgi:hypothetical protein